MDHASATIELSPDVLALPSVGGTIVVVGDVHGSRVELEKLLAAVDERHPDAMLVFVGDLADRGPDSPGCYRIVQSLVDEGRALMVSSNHGESLERKVGRLLALGMDAEQVAGSLEDQARQARAAGRPQPGTGMTARTARQFSELSDGTERLRQAVALERRCPHQLLVDAGRLLVVHGGVLPDLVGSRTARAVTVARYGTPTGRDAATGMVLGRDSWRVAWGDARRRDPSLPLVVYGHVAYARPFVGEHTVGIDTGAGKARHAPVTAAVYRDGRVVDLVAGLA